MQYAGTLSPACGAVPDRKAPRRPHVRVQARMAQRIMLAALVAATLIVSAASLAHDSEAPEPASWNTIMAEQNATLWGIAEAHPVQGRSTIDTVELICAENGLADSTIHAGQVLRVPGSEASLAMAQR